MLSFGVQVLIPKQNTYRKQKWLVAVRSLKSCVMCEGTRDIEAAHRNYKKGLALKTDDCLTACLCQRCHFSIDNGYSMSKEERREAMDKAILLTYLALHFAGLIALDKGVYIHQPDEVDTCFCDIVEELCEHVKAGRITLR